MIGAGDLRDRVRFDVRAPDANGDALGAWVLGFSVAANIEYLRGSEVALTHRLESRQPVSVTIRDSTQARAIGPGHRMVDTRRGTVFNVKSACPARQPGFLSVLAVAGEAAG